MARWASRKVTPAVDWRRAADPDDLKEYDAFGPWIDQVRSELAMPRIFQPWYPEFTDAEFLLKIPRDIDRSAARPGMDLYAAVLAVHKQGVCLLRNEDGHVTRQDAAWTQVVACGTYTNLLLARWSLLLSDGSAIHVRHNSVGTPTMAKVTQFVRARTVNGSEPLSQPALPPVPVPQDYFGSKLANLEWTFPAPVVPIHVEPRNRLCRDRRNRRRLSTGVMVVDTPRELVLVSCGEPVRPLFMPNYATNVVIVPYGGLTSFDVVPPADGRPHTFSSLVLRSGRQELVQPCLDHPWAAVTALAARGVPQGSPVEDAVGLR
ncbi:MAG: hypothetical protein IT193_00990 [Propionibacteriaceae bacterium]|nr:hypothetical protein [Propionibacteriaceae bacterium]